MNAEKVGISLVDNWEAEMIHLALLFPSRYECWSVLGQCLVRTHSRYAATWMTGSRLRFMSLYSFFHFSPTCILQVLLHVPYPYDTSGVKKSFTTEIFFSNEYKSCRTKDAPHGIFIIYWKPAANIYTNTMAWVFWNNTNGINLLDSVSKYPVW